MLASLEEYNTWTFLGMTSRWMPYSALYLVRQWIHVSVSLRRRVSCAGGLFGDDFRIVSVFSAELGSTADTCTASVYGAF